MSYTRRSLILIRRIKLIETDFRSVQIRYLGGFEKKAFWLKRVDKSLSSGFNVRWLKMSATPY